MTSYKNQVINESIQGLIAGGWPKALAESLEILLTRVYECGYHEAMLMSAPSTNIPYHTRCSVCGIGADGKVMGYVCNNSNCPVRVSC